MHRSAMSRALAPHLKLALLAAAVLGSSACTEQEQVGLPEWQLVEDLRLDADTEDFSVVSGVAVSPDGRIAIALWQDSEVRLYDSAGGRVAAVGRSGAGPGEFVRVGYMSWIGDTLFVMDPQLSRATYISSDGDLLYMRTLPHPLGETALGGTASDSTFRFFLAHAGAAEGMVFGIAAVSVRGAPVRSLPRVVLSVSDDGTARSIASPPQYTDDRWTVTIGGLSKYIPFALQPQIVFSSDGSRVAFMTTDQSQHDGTYEISVLTTSGDTVFARQYPFVGEPIPSSAMDSAIAAMADAGNSETGTSVRRYQEQARQRAPAVYSPVERIVLGLDHSVWVTLRATGEGGEALVLDERGDPLATVALPPRTRIHQATTSHVWVTERDAYDLASVVRYRVVPPDS